MSNFWRSRTRLGIVAFAATGMAFGLPAAAQSDEEEADEGGSLVEEIVVTATYRDTQLMDTPMTISALTDVDTRNGSVRTSKSCSPRPRTNYRKPAADLAPWSGSPESPIPGRPTGPMSLRGETHRALGQGPSQRHPLLRLRPWGTGAEGAEAA